MFPVHTCFKLARFRSATPKMLAVFPMCIEDPHQSTSTPGHPDLAKHITEHYETISFLGSQRPHEVSPAYVFQVGHFRGETSEIPEVLPMRTLFHVGHFRLVSAKSAKRFL